MSLNNNMCKCFMSISLAVSLRHITAAPLYDAEEFPSIWNTHLFTRTN